jgi:iron complex transport system substrate-binding protein
LTGKNKEAKGLIQNLSKRIKKIRFEAGKVKLKPRVLIIEWADPVMIAGHWVPEMVEIAGGNYQILKPKEVSRRIEWGEVLRLDPDVLIIAPCGFDIKRSKKEIGLITSKKGFKNLKAAKRGRVYLVDANAYLTRPGPRIIDGVEILTEIFHPAVFKRKHKYSDWQEVVY